MGKKLFCHVRFSKISRIRQGQMYEITMLMVMSEKPVLAEMKAHQNKMAD